MRAVFFGTPPHAVPALAALCELADVGLVVTRTDKPRARSRTPLPPPLKEAALDWAIPIEQPKRAVEVAETMRSIRPDVAVVVAYGQLIPGSLLEIPRVGFVNLHYSLLPRWRGASPVVRAILAGDEKTGVSLMQMDESLDTGGVLATAETSIGPFETAGRLTARLAALAAGLLTEWLPGVVEGGVAAQSQDDTKATAAQMVRVEEAFVDPARHSAEAVDRAVRAFNPRPGAWSIVDGKRLKIWKVMPTNAVGPEPGLIGDVGGRVLLGARRGALEVIEVQPEGRSRMSGADWMRGRRGAAARLEPPATPPPPR